jgi:HAD superfamily hydrolase (TIGR01509 family)
MTDAAADSRTAPSDDVPAGGPVPATGARLRGLVLDWGGVLTASLDEAMSDWARRDGVDFIAFRDVMRQWAGLLGSEDGAGDPLPAPGAGSVPGAGSSPGADSVPDPVDGAGPVEGAGPVTAAGPVETAGPVEVAGPGPAPGASVAELEQAADAGPAGSSPAHRLERGEISAADFERVLAAELAVRGSPVLPEGLLRRLLSGLTELDPRMLDLVRRARAAGLRTALLSNSWGDHYPDQLWQGLFDAVVISGEVGMRKPEPGIFRYTAERLELTTRHCVMVDDLPHNITGAVAVGMVGVVHRSYDETLGELEALFGVPLH